MYGRESAEQECRLHRQSAQRRRNIYGWHHRHYVWKATGLLPNEASAFGWFSRIIFYWWDMDPGGREGEEKRRRTTEHLCAITFVHAQGHDIIWRQRRLEGVLAAHLSIFEENVNGPKIEEQTVRTVRVLWFLPRCVLSWWTKIHKFPMGNLRGLCPAGHEIKRSLLQRRHNATVSGIIQTMHPTITTTNPTSHHHPYVVPSHTVTILILDYMDELTANMPPC